MLKALESNNIRITCLVETLYQDIVLWDGNGTVISNNQIIVLKTPQLFELVSGVGDAYTKMSLTFNDENMLIDTFTIEHQNDTKITIITI